MVESWHYPRHEIASSYLKQLEEGGPSLAIFAERRRGKTQLLLEDMMPMAESQGIAVVYIDFWEQRNNPSACIARGVKRALDKLSTGRMLRWKKEVKLKLPLLEAKINQDSSTMPEVAADALEFLTLTKKPWLVMFDEIQHLASTKEYEDVIFTLRSFLNANSKKIKAIFTGSSQDRLNRIFRHHNAAC